MAVLPNEHNELYFDKLVRVQKSDAVLSLIKATFNAYKEKDVVVKDEIAKKLKPAYDIFKTGGAGTYDGNTSQFSSQYTIGHEMAIWHDSDLHLTFEAMLVACDVITIKDYFDMVFLNYIQLIDGKVYHLLLEVLNYLKNKKTNSIKVSEICCLFDGKCNTETARALFHFLNCTSYFFCYKKDAIKLSNFLSLDELISKCNKKYLSDGGYLSAKNELSDPLTYENYIFSRKNKNILFENMSSDEAETLFRNWLKSKLCYYPSDGYNGYSSMLFKIFNILESTNIVNKDIFRCSDINDYQIFKELFLENKEAVDADQAQHNNGKAAFAFYSDFINQISIFGLENVKKGIDDDIDIDSLLKSNTSQPSISYWICPANPFSYKHDSALETNGFIDWGQDVFSKANVGDIVYLYSSNLEMRIKHKLFVEEKNLTKDTKFDDSDFWIDERLKDKPRNNYVRLRLVKTVIDDGLTLSNLEKNGMKRAALVKAFQLKDLKLINYINSFFEQADELNITEPENVDYDNVIRNSSGDNIIYYGTPGCGKSYFVDDKYSCEGYVLFRTVFHPEYSNTDFVGQLIPRVDPFDKTKITYEFKDGIFTEAFKYAYYHPNEKVALIIEEINRGNASAIFGEIFQLLDRDENGKSHYFIHNDNLASQLKKPSNYDIYLPSNLSLIGTMNTSDQNVYTLDTAFKRRWTMIKIKNTFDEMDADVNNSNPKLNYLRELSSMYIPGSSYTWREFIKNVNGKISTNTSTISSHSDDKEIGLYFVSKKYLIDVKNGENIHDKSKKILFAEKVLMYIWNDVAKTASNQWFEAKTLDKVLEDFENSTNESLLVFSNKLFPNPKPPHKAPGNASSEEQ